MKNLSIIIFCLILSTSLQAQLYITPQIGYSLSLNPEVRYSEISYNNYELINSTSYHYSQGLYSGISVGYILKNNFFIEGGVSFQVLGDFNESIHLDQPETIYEYSAIGINGDIEYGANSYQFYSLIGYQVQHKKFSIFIKAGPNYLNSKIYLNNNYLSIKAGTNFDPEFTPEIIEREISCKPNIGLYSSLGIKYALKRNWELNLEVKSIFNNCILKKGEIRYYEYNEETNDFVLSKTYEMQINESDKIDFSQIGVHFGVSYFF
jgi:opacity protein-like surface antigen